MNKVVAYVDMFCSRVIMTIMSESYSRFAVAEESGGSFNGLKEFCESSGKREIA